MPYPISHEFGLKPTYVPPFSYYILRALQPHYASISPLEELLSSQVSVGTTRVNVVDSLLPHAKHDMGYVDPPTWAILVQIFDDLPQQCFKYTLALNDPHLSTLATIPSTPNFSVVTFLDLSGCKELLDGNISFLKGLTSLCVFDASRTRLTDQGVRNFKSTLFLREPGPAYLRSWSLRECKGVTAKALGSLLAFPLLCVLDLRGTSVQPSQLKASFWPQSTLLPVSENMEYFAPCPQHRIPELLQELEKSSFLHSQGDAKAKAPYVIHVDRIRPSSYGNRSFRGSAGVSRIAENAYHVSSTYVQPSDREEKYWPRYERPQYYSEDDYDDNGYSYSGFDVPDNGWWSEDERSSDSEDLQSINEDDSGGDISDTSSSSEDSPEPAESQDASPTDQEPIPSSPISTRTIQSSSSPVPDLPVGDWSAERSAMSPTGLNELIQNDAHTALEDDEEDSLNAQDSPRPTHNSHPTEEIILGSSESDSSDVVLDDVIDRETRNAAQAIPGFFNPRAQAGLAPPTRKRPRRYSFESSRSYDSEEEHKKQRTNLSILGDVELLLLRRPPPWSTVQKLIVAKQKIKASAELQSRGQGGAGQSGVSLAQPAQKKATPDGAKAVWNLIRASSSKKSTLPSSSSGSMPASSRPAITAGRAFPLAALSQPSQAQAKPVRRTTLGRPPKAPGTVVWKLK
ncbi:hypothetical protein FRC08_010305 [Ceratobasidium sp. 394]|nr:hypothetical protein FRC08_010305 [Ceratobasidium sp. 394]KAG9090269.1 hypothetical protein FS749_000694 [Ceratobasidium sp. UAMH 11750]